MESDYVPWTRSRVRQFALMLARYAFWYLVTDAFCHVFYSSALSARPRILRTVDMWTLCGIGYAVGQFFHLKYTVMYGVPRAFFFADGMEDLPTPKCISRIHLYSDMWRHFDPGLHKFMRRYGPSCHINMYTLYNYALHSSYIYNPIVKTNNGFIMRLLASGGTFIFAWIWHGLQTNILIWCTLNFLGIILEAGAREITSNPTYVKLEVGGKVLLWSSYYPHRLFSEILAESPRPAQVPQPDGLLHFPPGHPFELLLPDVAEPGENLQGEDADIMAHRHTSYHFHSLLRLTVLL